MYEFYIDGVRLPVTPGEISFSNGTNIDVVDLANGGKITRWIGRELETITFKASFPFTRYAPFVYSGVQEPQYYIDQFKYLMQTGTSFEFVILNSRGFNSFDRALVMQNSTLEAHSNAFSTTPFVRTMYIQSLQQTQSAENGSEPELEFTLLEYVAKKTKTYTISGRTIDVIVANPFELALTEEQKNIPTISHEEKEIRGLPSPTAPVFHFVKGVQPVYNGKPYGSPRTPTRDEVAKMTEDQRIAGGFTLYLIAKNYYGYYDAYKIIQELNPHLAEKLPGEILEMGTKVKLRDLRPGESLMQDGTTKILDGKKKTVSYL